MRQAHIFRTIGSGSRTPILNNGLIDPWMEASRMMAPVRDMALGPMRPGSRMREPAPVFGRESPDTPGGTIIMKRPEGL